MEPLFETARLVVQPFRLRDAARVEAEAARGALALPGGPVPNYGWPCYEGTMRQGGYRVSRLALCDSLYAAPAGTVTMPHYEYAHSQQVAPGDGCPTGGSSPSGLAFYPATGGGYPAAYRGALFFADYSRDCIWVMKADASGLPAPGLLEPFVAPAANPAQVQRWISAAIIYSLGAPIRRLRDVAAHSPSS